MAKKTTMLDVFERNKYDLLTSVKKSKSWFDQQVNLLTRQSITPNSVMRSSPEDLTSKVNPGYLYMFMYDAKMKNELPYYDAFPLVFPFRKTPDGFIGLNMHYLPYQYRIQLLDSLLSFKSNEKLDETTRLKYSWQVIDGISRFKAAEPCVKRYLISNVRTPFRKINSSDWATAMLLPVEQFVGASSRSVWQDSIKQMRK